MEQETEFKQPPIIKGRLLFFSLGIALLTLALYLLFSELAYWLPIVGWAGPLADLPPESIWLLRGTIVPILACGFGLLLLHGFVKIFSGQRLYLSFGRITGRQRNLLAKNITIYFVILIAQEVLVSLLDLGRFVEGPEISLVQSGLLGSFLLFFFIVIAAPIFEEALFRGFLYARLRSGFKFWPAFIISGLFFSLLHFDPQGSTTFNVYNIFNSFVFSYFVTKVFEATNNLWTSIIFHGFYNGWVMLLLFLLAALESLTAF